MSIKKIILPNKELRYEVVVRTIGSKGQIRRRFDRKVDAQEFLDSIKDRKKEIQSSGPAKPLFDIEATTFNKEADHWLESKRDEFTEGYLRAVNPALKRIKESFGSRPISNFTPELLTTFRKALKKEGLSSSTQNRYTEIISRVVNFSVVSKRISFDPTKGYEKVKEIYEEMDFWDSDEVYTFLSFANRKYPRGSEKRWVYLAYLFALETGVRANELWGLKIKDLPETGTKIKISRQALGGSRFSATKGKDSRFVPYSSGLKDEINYLLKDELIEQTPERTLFVNNALTCIEHNNFRNRVFEADLKQSGLRPIRFHDLRHTAISMWVRNGINLPTVQKMAGHKDLKTTMRYVHILGREIEEIGASHGLSIKENASKKFKVV